LNRESDHENLVDGRDAGFDMNDRERSSSSTEGILSVQTLLQVPEDHQSTARRKLSRREQVSREMVLVPVEEFAGQIADVSLLEGAIVLSVRRKPILSSDSVDYIYSLWAYLVTGLTEIASGREFSTGYPDIPIDIHLTPCRAGIHIKVDGHHARETTVGSEELLAAMVPAGILFFEVLRPFAPDADRYIAELGALTRLPRSPGP
jgi:hypothetical protein